LKPAVGFILGPVPSQVVFWLAVIGLIGENYKQIYNIHISGLENRDYGRRVPQARHLSICKSWY
jgi:hypothetical protein